MRLEPIEAMKLAIEEAKKASGFVAPNPLVGCVILDKDNSLIGQGYHARYGEAHAEINAINSVKDKSDLNGAHVYVTLEPCAHQGRTPPCAEALIKFPFASITYGLRDPFPKVAGKGLEILRNAGIELRTLPELHDELENLAEVFLTNVRERRAFAALKVATSLDGQMALKSGESQWITGPAARDHVQYLRGIYDAVLVGAGTFLKDNPKLISRHPRFASKPQKAVIVDHDGRTLSRLPRSETFKARPPESLYLVTGINVDLPPELSAVQHIRVREENGLLNWAEILTHLHNAGLYSVFIEGGAHVFSGLLASRLADRIYIYVAPKILGDGLGWTKGLDLPGLRNAIELQRVERQYFGPDLLISGRLFLNRLS